MHLLCAPVLIKFYSCKKRVLHQQVTVATRYDNDDMEVDGSDEKYVTTTKHKFKHQARQPKDHFEKLLEVACPNHTYLVQHKLMECAMMKKFMTSGALAKGKKPEEDPGEKGMKPFPMEEVVMTIYD
jgi:hypothetical protein